MRLRLRPDGGFAAVVIGVHLAAAVSPVIVMEGWAGPALALLLAANGLSLAWRLALHRGRTAVVGLEIDGPGQVVLESGDGRRLTGMVDRARWVLPWGVSLRIRSRSTHWIFITPGMLEPQAFRHLRIWALWDRLPPRAVMAQPETLST